MSDDNSLAPHPNSRLPLEGNLFTGEFQDEIARWMVACFGSQIAEDGEERNYRFLEEALELVQANGCTAERAHELVDYVFGRPVGDVRQEVGGVMVTLAALCNVLRVSIGSAANRETYRIWGKIEAIRAKQAAKKIKGGALP